MFGWAVLVLLVLMAIFAPLLAPHDPLAQDLTRRAAAPTIATSQLRGRVNPMSAHGTRAHHVHRSARSAPSGGTTMLPARTRMIAVMPAGPKPRSFAANPSVAPPPITAAGVSQLADWT